MIAKQNVTIKNVQPFVENILKFEAYDIPLETKRHISKLFSEYFLVNSNFILTDVNKDYTLDGLLTADIKPTRKHIKLDNKLLEEIKKQTNFADANEFITLLTRVNDCIDKHHPAGYEAELVTFSSLQKGKGIGSSLINEFEAELKEQDIRNYFLFTDDNCDYNWYKEHGYNLIEEYDIKIDDLTHIFKEDDSYKVYMFDKKI